MMTKKRREELDSKLLRDMQTMDRIAAEVVPRMKEERARFDKLAKARESVIRAAKAWVNYIDDGLANSSHRQGQINQRLANAVARLEKLEGK